MEQRTYKKDMTVPTEMLVQEPLLVEKIQERVKSELIDGIVGLVSTGKEYIISLSEMVEIQRFTVDFMSHFTQRISLVQLVRCKDCKFHNYDDMGSPYCIKKYEYGWKDDDFCSKAEGRTDE